MLVVYNFVIFLAIFGSGESASKKLPPYIVACSQSDPKINKCVVDHGNEILAKIRHGDKEYKISPIAPLKILEATVTSGSNLKLTLRNADVIGLDRLTILSADMNFGKDGNSLKLKLDMPTLQLVGPYEIDGKILILPVTGKGDSNVTFDNTILSVEQNFHEENNEIVLEEPTAKFDTKKIYFKFDNLFNGDERLGTELNKFMNENWKEIKQDLEPSFEAIVANIIKNFLHQILTGVPYTDIINH